ncbi:sialidase family protein [Tahibacter amnicola]|uniref:BNR/Asp-box repeat protein n=1 Tax=Tahibacter amnicola TaxID=2976241 RepID=A0ABY6B880_9GAMM|nr:sialidase family protein [Tahibacter amnicola]UXI66291.1 hypothetical protein N4264_16210 [Tahibacter amnicola]
MRALARTERWEPVGPAPVLNGQTPQAFTLPSPVSGRVSALAFDPIDNAAYVGAALGGLWRSTDGGASWRPLTDGLASLAIGSIAVAPGPHAVNHGTIYIGTGEGNVSGDSYGGVGVYKSTDSGRTWQGPFGQEHFLASAISAIVIDRANPQHLIAGTTFGQFGGLATFSPYFLAPGLFASHDGGITWQRLPTQAPFDDVSTLIQDPVTPTTWWIANMGFGQPDTGGLQRSTDNGVTWHQVFGKAQGLPTLAEVSPGRIWITGSDPGNAQPSVLYVATSEFNDDPENLGPFGRVYRSADGGTTWQELPGARRFCQFSCFYDMPILAEPGSASVLYTGGQQRVTQPETTPSLFMRSTDGGATFVSRVRSESTHTALHAYVHTIASVPGRPNEIWVGTDGGVWKSVDRGDSWINVNTNLQITPMVNCDLHPTDPAKAYGASQAVGTLGWTGGAEWLHLDSGDGGWGLIDPSHPQNLVHTNFNQNAYVVGLAYTTAGFAAGPGDYQYSLAHTDPTIGNGINPFDRQLYYVPIHLDRGVSDTIYYGSDHLYRANTFFAHPPQTAGIFTALGAGAGGQLLASPDVFDGLSAIETVANSVPGLDAQMLFTGSRAGYVYRSTNGGASFQQVDAFPTVIAQPVSDIRVDPRDPRVVYQSRAGFTAALPAHNVRKSTDAGLTWADASTGLPDVPVNALVLDPVIANTVWIGTDAGVFVSTDGAASWQPYTDGMPAAPVFDMAASRATGQILACTHGRGVFRLTLDAIFVDGFGQPD